MESSGWILLVIIALNISPATVLEFRLRKAERFFQSIWNKKKIQSLIAKIWFFKPQITTHNHASGFLTWHLFRKYFSHSGMIQRITVHTIYQSMIRFHRFFSQRRNIYFAEMSNFGPLISIWKELKKPSWTLSIFNNVRHFFSR